MTILDHLNPDLAALRPYEPRRPIEDVAEELALDPDIIDKLASNESALGPSPKALAAAAAALPEMHLYPDGAATLLRRRLAGHHDLDPSQFIIGNGSNEVLELVAHCFLRPGVSAVFSEHAFIVYKLLAQMFGATAVEVPMAEGLVHDLDAMAAAIRPDTRVVFLCNPNNPTGSAVAAERLAEFAGSLPDDVLLVLDEAYAEVCLAPTFDSRALIRAGRPVIVCRTFSKAYGLAGLRIGYGMAPAPLVAALHRPRQPFNVNRLAQIAAAAALDDHEFVESNRRLCRESKIWFEALCSRLSLDFVPAAANFMLIRVGDGAAVADALTARGLIVRPMAGYGLPDYLRVTFGSPEQNERCGAALASVLDTD
jgi:histidinol-phosphate aminotransferase